MEKSATKKPKVTKNKANALIFGVRHNDCVVTKKIIPYAAHNNALRQVMNQYAVWPLTNCKPTSAANSTIGRNSGLRRSSTLPEANFEGADGPFLDRSEGQWTESQ